MLSEWMANIESAVMRFVNNEKYLLQIHASERCMVHKLANLIESDFGDFSTDVEYNRNGKDEKRLYHEIVTLGLIKQVRQLKTDDQSYYSIISPDIIIHERGTTRNHIAIEVKKASNNNGLEKEFDRMKLRALTGTQTSSLKYTLGVYIEINDQNDFDNPIIEFYHRGTMMEKIHRQTDSNSSTIQSQASSRNDFAENNNSKF